MSFAPPPRLSHTQQHSCAIGFGSHQNFKTFLSFRGPTDRDLRRTRTTMLDARALRYAEIEALRAEAFAEDLDITDEMLEWPEAAVRGARVATDSA